ncbi:MAG: hypothetical protein N2Z21_03075 [Candidatus Sumerlaeaceae bacterium]|nr:hypothetical protein [Candidatus Sumerlaeaceae bacterium]
MIRDVESHPFYPPFVGHEFLPDFGETLACIAMGQKAARQFRGQAPHQKLRR